MRSHMHMLLWPRRATENTANCSWTGPSSGARNQGLSQPSVLSRDECKLVAHEGPDFCLVVGREVEHWFYIALRQNPLFPHEAHHLAALFALYRVHEKDCPLDSFETCVHVASWSRSPS